MKNLVIGFASVAFASVLAVASFAPAHAHSAEFPHDHAEPAHVAAPALDRPVVIDLPETTIVSAPRKAKTAPKTAPLTKICTDWEPLQSTIVQRVKRCDYVAVR